MSNMRERILHDFRNRQKWAAADMPDTPEHHLLELLANLGEGEVVNAYQECKRKVTFARMEALV